MAWNVAELYKNQVFFDTVNRVQKAMKNQGARLAIFKGAFCTPPARPVEPSESLIGAHGCYVRNPTHSSSVGTYARVVCSAWRAWPRRFRPPVPAPGSRQAKHS